MIKVFPNGNMIDIVMGNFLLGCPNNVVGYATRDDSDVISLYNRQNNAILKMPDNTSISGNFADYANGAGVPLGASKQAVINVLATLLNFSVSGGGGGGGGGGSVTITANSTDFSTATAQATQIIELVAIKNKLIALPATEGKQDSIIATLQQILAEQRDDVFVQTTLWVDRATATEVYYREERVRSQDDGTISTVYTRLSDNVVVVSLPAGAIPVVGANDREVQFFRYKAIANGTGYATNDWLANSVVFDTGGNGAVVSNSWYNLSTSASIATPNQAHLQAENEVTLVSIANKLDTLNANDFATESKQNEIIAKIATPLATNPKGNTPSTPVRLAPQPVFRTTFAKVIASGTEPEFFTVVRTGTGQTVSQSGGNLVLTSGTNANQETILRSTQTFQGNFLSRVQVVLSQRIANNNFFVELVDLIGDNLAFTINSPTSVTVTFTTNPFTAENVGQSVYLGNFTGTVGTISGRYAIASVAGNNVNFTVAGFPASGSGTLSAFGWNYHQLVYSGTSATSASYDTQKCGWNSGFTSVSINSTASLGHMAIMGNEDGVAFLSDQLVASATAISITQRATRNVNIADENANLYLQFRVVNGTSAPASNTTWTIGMCSVENYASQPVAITTSKAQSQNFLQPVEIRNTPNVGTVTTITTVATVNTVSSASLQGNTTNGASTYFASVVAGTFNVTQVKAGATLINTMIVSNDSGTARFLKIYNALSASVVGGTTNATLNIMVPANQTVSVPTGPYGIRLSTGFSFAVTAGIALNDNANISPNDITVSATYY